MTILYTERLQHVKPDDGSAAAHSRAIRRKPPVTRQMLCTDIEVDTGIPEEAFIAAWNTMANDNFLLDADPVDDPLTLYRKRELMRLITEIGRIDTVPFWLMLQTLDCISVHPDGSLEVKFLAGVRIRGDGSPFNQLSSRALQDVSH